MKDRLIQILGLEENASDDSIVDGVRALQRDSQDLSRLKARLDTTAQMENRIQGIMRETQMSHAGALEVIAHQDGEAARLARVTVTQSPVRITATTAGKQK